MLVCVYWRVCAGVLVMAGCASVLVLGCVLVCLCWCVCLGVLASVCSCWCVRVGAFLLMRFALVWLRWSVCVGVFARACVCARVFVFVSVCVYVRPEYTRPRQGSRTAERKMRYPSRFARVILALPLEGAGSSFLFLVIFAAASFLVEGMISAAIVQLAARAAADDAAAAATVPVVAATVPAAAAAANQDKIKMRVLLGKFFGIPGR